MINKIIKLLSFTLMSSVALFSSSIVISDESLASEQIENIVVTATRNEQQQQDIAAVAAHCELLLQQCFQFVHSLNSRH